MMNINNRTDLSIKVVDDFTNRNVLRTIGLGELEDNKKYSLIVNYENNRVEKPMEFYRDILSSFVILCRSLHPNSEIYVLNDEVGEKR